MLYPGRWPGNLWKIIGHFLRHFLGWCRGGSRYVEAKGGFLKCKWKSFKVSWFLHFKVPKFQMSKNSNSFSIDIDPISLKHHFMFFERDWSHTIKIPFHIFWKILIPFSRFQHFQCRFPRRYLSQNQDVQTLLERIFISCSAPIFSKQIKTLEFRTVEHFKNRKFLQWKSSLEMIRSFLTFQIILSPKNPPPPLGGTRAAVVGLVRSLTISSHCYSAMRLCCRL